MFFGEQERWEALSPGSASEFMAQLLCLLVRLKDGSAFTVRHPVCSLTSPRFVPALTHARVLVVSAQWEDLLEMTGGEVESALRALTAVFRRTRDPAVLRAALFALSELALPAPWADRTTVRCVFWEGRRAVRG